MGIAAKIGGKLPFVPAGGIWAHEQASFIENGYIEVPEGVYSVRIYQSGGGGGGGVGNTFCSSSNNGEDYAIGGSGGSGYFQITDANVKPHDKIYCQIGSGGQGAKYNDAVYGSHYVRYRIDLVNAGNGSATIVSLPDGTVVTANGGKGGSSNSGTASGYLESSIGGNGNAGGGGGCRACTSNNKYKSGDSGRNGSNGGASTFANGGTGAGKNTTFAGAEFNGGGAGAAPYFGNTPDWYENKGYAGVPGGGANVGGHGTAHTGAGGGGNRDDAGNGASGYVYMQWNRGGH